MGNTVQARALQRAADILGGKDPLRAALHVPMARLEEWLAGRTTPPMDMFLKAVDIISLQTTNTSTAAMVRAKILTGQSASLRADTERHVARARELRDTGRAMRSAPCVASFLAAVFGPHEHLAMLEWALDTAIEAGAADMGNVQLKRDDGLHIVAQRGFKAPFLQFFDCVADTAGGRVLVPDVAAVPMFADNDVARVLEAAGVRALQSTPLMSSTGAMLGMLSTHYDHPQKLDEAELQDIDFIARRTAYWLEQVTA